jgi:hypothetical protein
MMYDGTTRKLIFVEKSIYNGKGHDFIDQTKLNPTYVHSLDINDIEDLCAADQLVKTTNIGRIPVEHMLGLYLAQEGHRYFEDVLKAIPESLEARIRGIFSANSTPIVSAKDLSETKILNEGDYADVDGAGAENDVTFGEMLAKIQDENGRNDLYNALGNLVLTDVSMASDGRSFAASSLGTSIFHFVFNPADSDFTIPSSPSDFLTEYWHETIDLKWDEILAEVDNDIAEARQLIPRNVEAMTFLPTSQKQILFAGEALDERIAQIDEDFDSDPKVAPLYLMRCL